MGKLSAAWIIAAVFALSGCVRAEPAHKRFDIAAQPAPAALNEFARQADVTLIFSYDLVSGVYIPELKGRYTVEEALARLLDGTRLEYGRSSGGAYLICKPSAARGCGWE